MTKRLVVIGGGISGLAAARAAVDEAAGAGGKLEVTVLERSAEVGGKANSNREDGWLVEGGPAGYLDNEAVMPHLVDAAGVRPDLVQARDSAAKRFIVRGGQMRLVDPNPIAFARSGLLSAGGMLRLVAEPFVRRRRSEVDESVWSFAARRIGRQAADRLIAPMVLGVFAGDARALSLPSAFPRLHELEIEHGSLVRGMLAARKKNTGGPAGPGGKLTSFKGGLQSLPRGLADTTDFTVRCSAGVEAVTSSGDSGWSLRVSGDTEALPADAVVFAGEPWAMAPLLRDTAPAVADELDGIACPPVTVVGLGFRGDVLKRMPVGFGVLIPRGEGFRILGCLWETHVFPERSPDGCLLVRAMLGGAVDPAAAELGDEDLLHLVRHDLSRLMGLGDTPSFHRIVRWPRAIPQYELGHGARVTRIEGSLAERPGLFMAGNGLYGIAFGKAAAAGVGRGEAAARYLLSL